MDEFDKIQFTGITPFISRYFTHKFMGVDCLSSAERNIIQGSAEKRRIDFSTGRYCARQALGMLINSKPAIMQGEGREPLWPNGVVGSISHSGKLAGAVAALQSNIMAIGVDIETVGEVKPEIWDLIFK
ncbi:4'-phosphopantetheinyl transferase family protein [Mucilaginibacter terrae]|uniref:4'-phosphopantetheinyl transferase EntD n=1 Tax=Mucilaginibacter terrae TaxID=1955052 RepID=A0ABU3GMG2_9SPHI|nr:hypothetical protein [Mucilaginibacter terrae]MDT3400980.1 4'-phosphopantetheinyl transferase EntD [Mucilaginibacter terrae]